MHCVQLPTASNHGGEWKCKATGDAVVDTLSSPHTLDTGYSTVGPFIVPPMMAGKFAQVIRIIGWLCKDYIGAIWAQVGILWCYIRILQVIYRVLTCTAWCHTSPPVHNYEYWTVTPKVGSLKVGSICSPRPRYQA